MSGHVVDLSRYGDDEPTGPAVADLTPGMAPAAVLPEPMPQPSAPTVVVIHEGQRYEVDSVHGWVEDMADLSPARRARFVEAVAKGLILGRDGEPLAGRALDLMRRRLIVGSNYWEGDARPPAGDIRYLVPGLWQWGTVPWLGGNPKAGKSTLITDELVPALVDPGRQFLGHFGASTLTRGELNLGIVLFNAEVNPAAYEASLLDGGWDPDGDVKVVHLEQETGGPQSFDLSDRALVEEWSYRLTYCDACDASDDWAPIVVIVDGVTAILAAAGKGPEWYGQWNAGFRQLLRMIGTPNGLVTGHNTLQGGHLMGGVESMAGADGLWSYSCDNPDDPNSVRRFAVVPRMGPATPRTPVRREGDRLLMGRVGRPACADAAGGSAVAGPSRRETIREEVLAYVRQANAAGYGPSVRDLRENVAARHPEVDGARDDLVAEGAVVVRPRAGRGGGTAHWLPG